MPGVLTLGHCVHTVDPVPGNVKGRRDIKSKMDGALSLLDDELQPEFAGAPEHKIRMILIALGQYLGNFHFYRLERRMLGSLKSVIVLLQPGLLERVQISGLIMKGEVGSYGLLRMRVLPGPEIM